MSRLFTERQKGIALMLALALQCTGLHAALLFRSVEQIESQQRWSPIRNYASESDMPTSRGGGPQEVRVFVFGLITREDVASAQIMVGLVESGRQKISGNS